MDISVKDVTKQLLVDNVQDLMKRELVQLRTHLSQIVVALIVKTQIARSSKIIACIQLIQFVVQFSRLNNLN